MKLLIFHNILFAQYKSIYFEALYNAIKSKNGELLVMQTSYAEKSRLNHFKIDELVNDIKYPFQLISTKPLEDVSPFKILVNWILTIIKFKPDVVNFTGYNSINIFIALLFCKILGIKTIITNESVIKKAEHSKTIRNSILKQIKKCITSQADYFYTFGINANQLLFDLDISKQQIINFGNTFDKKKFKPYLSKKTKSNSVPQLLFIGRLIDEKNLFQTIEVLSEVNKKSPITFTIVGDGPLEIPLKSFCNQHKFDFVSFQQPVKWNEISNLYPKYDYLVLFSKSETWGMVANEAQYFHLKVLCTADCGCANDLVINHFNGLVINDLNDQHTPAEITNYLSNSTDSYNFTQRNNEIFDETYAVKNYIDRLFEIHES